MLLFDGGLTLLGVALWLFALIDVITTPAQRCRNLPKLAWVFIVLLLADLGAIVWLVAGRRWSRADQSTAGRSTSRVSSFGPARPQVAPRATNPDDDEEFLAGLRARAEEQRRRARESGADEAAGE